MALAFLMRDLQLARTTAPFNLQAFIVNHRAREHSEAEARSVGTRLKNLGPISSNMSAPVLTGSAKA